MQLAALVTLLGVFSACQALQCYSCVGLGILDDLSLPAGLTDLVKQAGTIPSCDEFDPANPDPKFKVTCPALHSGCLKMTDPNNAKNQMRSCFVVAQDRCEGPLCYCDTDLCNGAGAVWPSAVLVLAALAAVLAGLGH